MALDSKTSRSPRLKAAAVRLALGRAIAGCSGPPDSRSGEPLGAVQQAVAANGLSHAGKSDNFAR
jgi:hypothetical protein